MTHSENTPEARGPVHFATTHWTRVLASRGEAPEAREALSQLCADYYAPVVAFLKHETRSEDRARDLAHAFFERILEYHGLEGAHPARGRFRSYLLGALKHFRSHQRELESRAKRGGGAPHVPLESGSNDSDLVAVADPHSDPDAAVFDRAWGLCILGRALEQLARDARASGTFDAFEILKPWLSGNADSPTQTQAQAARKLGLSDGAFRLALHRLRRRFREEVKAEIAKTVPHPGEIPDELNHLITAVSRGT